MANRITFGLLALMLAACGASSTHLAVVTSPSPAILAPSPSPESTPSPAPRPTGRVLDIKIHYQEHNLTCEAAALKMALAYEGIAVDEMTLVGYMTNDRRPAQFDSKGRLVAWGDPAQGFVGDPDGHIERLTGYGVYFEPVAAAANRAGAHAIKAGGGLYGSPIAPSEVYDAVLDGHPVVAWISNTYRTVNLSRYTAFDGATVSYTLTEHAVTLIGVRPDAVLINDPWFGQHWHSKAQFEAAYRTFDNMAVIVGS
ncbi:MAG TPA: C39 family peptidase [Candidatus Dormibacteraeota bacterium]|nr:C39 family peptidase [Candidatus Dormibacteraeota bacterium]